jgi:hypothetical protein
MVEKKTEDIIDRLEALRKRVPEAEKKPEEEPSVEVERKRRARIVGVIVVLLIVFGVAGVIYKFVWQPKVAEAIEKVREERAREEARLEEERRRREEEKQALLLAKSQMLDQVREAFQGLPPVYATAKSDLEDAINEAEDMTALLAIDFETPANEGWRNYRLAEMDSLLETVDEIELKVDGDVFRNINEIRQRILSLSYKELKTAVIEELKYEYVPMRLNRIPAGGFPKENTSLNIYFKKRVNESDPDSPFETIYLAKDARVISILRARSSGEIALSESETRKKIAGGVEGFGTVPSLSIGATSGTLTGTFTGSAGTAMSETQTTLTIDLVEVQKAYAANKISESDFTAMLDKYGLRLGEIEESTKFGEFDVEYLMLVRVTADEAPGLVLRLYTPEDRDNIYVTFTEWYPY